MEQFLITILSCTVTFFTTKIYLKSKAKPSAQLFSFSLPAKSYSNYREKIHLTHADSMLLDATIRELEDEVKTLKASVTKKNNLTLIEELNHLKSAVIFAIKDDGSRYHYGSIYSGIHEYHVDVLKKSDYEICLIRLNEMVRLIKKKMIEKPVKTKAKKS